MCQTIVDLIDFSFEPLYLCVTDIFFCFYKLYLNCLHDDFVVFVIFAFGFLSTKFYLFISFWVNCICD